MALAAAGLGAQAFERQRDLLDIGADKMGSAQHRKRVLDDVAAGHADARVDLLAADPRRDQRMVGMQREIDQPVDGLGMFAEADDFLDACFLGQLGEQRPALVVAVDERSAVRLDAFEDFRLGSGDVVERLEMAEMRSGDQRDDRDMRPDQLHQRADLALMVHADLEDRVVAIGRHARQRQRHAPVIVERGCGGMHLADGRQARGEALPWCWSFRPSR